MKWKPRDRRKYLAWWQPPYPDTQKTYWRFMGWETPFWYGGGSPERHIHRISHSMVALYWPVA